MTLADILYFNVGIGMIELAPESFFDRSSLKKEGIHSLAGRSFGYQKNR
jgi:hypothetical protein